MNYGEIISRAWNIFWKQKALWLFYLVCMLPIFVYSFAANFIDPASGLNSSGIFLVCSTLIVVLISLLLTVFAQVGIIRGVYNSTQDPQHTLTFRDIYDEVLPRYKRALGLYLLLYAAGVVVTGVLVLAMGGFSVAGAAQESFPVGLLLLCYCLFIPVMLIAGYLFQVIQVALVVEDLPLGNAVSRGWEVFRKNFGSFLVLGLLLLLISIGFGIIVSIPSFCIMSSMVTDVMGSGMVDPATFAFQMPWYYYPITLLISLVSTLFSIFVMAVLVLAFLEVTKPVDLVELPEPLDNEQEPA